MSTPTPMDRLGDIIHGVCQPHVDEANPIFCAMVNAMRDEHYRTIGFYPVTADLVDMARAGIKAAAAAGLAMGRIPK